MFALCQKCYDFVGNVIKPHDNELRLSRFTIKATWTSTTTARAWPRLLQAITISSSFTIQCAVRLPLFPPSITTPSPSQINDLLNPF